MNVIPFRRLGVWLVGMSMSAGAWASDIAMHSEPYRLDSGVHDGSGDEAVPVFEAIIHVPGTPWMHVHIEAYSLGRASYILLRSLADGAWQRLEPWSLPLYSNTSAGLNGDEVLLQLFAAPQDRGVFVVIDAVQIPDVAQSVNGPTGGVRPKDICGDHDDRVRSYDARVGRLGGGTAWLIPNGGVLTVGHMGEPDGDIRGFVEFNVPLSLSDGRTRQADPSDQYAVDTSSVQFESDGSGEDWAIFRVHPNSNTGLRAHDVQGFFRLTTAVPSEDQLVRVTGHGADNMPAGTGGPNAACCDTDGDDECEHNCNSMSHVQQTATGRFDELSGTTLEYEVDTLPGNSGSPVIWEANGSALGIHGQGGCDSFIAGYENHGTWFGYEPLRNAITAYNPPNTFWVDVGTPDPIQSGGVFNPFATVATAVQSVGSGATINIIAGSYRAAAGNTFVAGETGKAVTLVSQLGTAVIGN